MLFNIQSLTEAGITPNQPEYVQQRIRITNQLAPIIAALTVPYIGATYFLFRPLTTWPIICFTMCLLCVLLNYVGAVLFSRIVLSVSVTMLVSIYHAFLIQATEMPIPSMYLLQLATLCIPWMAFDFREKILLTLTTLIGALWILLLPVANAWLETPVDNSFFRQSWGAAFCSAIAVIVLIISVYYIQLINYQSQNKNKLLLIEAEKRNQELKNSQAERNLYIQQVQHAQEEDKKRTWASEGLAKMGEILRSNHDSLSALGDRMIAPLVKYVNANQGGIFVVNRENEREPFLELITCYAFNRKKFVEKHIAIGQGLVGQSYLEKDKIYLTDVPDHYIRITSGLGDANPRSILIVPLKVNEEVVGVIELASFQKFEPYQIEFIEKLGESMASMITNVRINEATRKLLEASQQQAEEMKAQEEEMRQNMEELAATQEEMQRILREAQDKEQYLNSILNSSKDTIFTIDAHIRLQNFNTAFSNNLFGMGIHPEKGMNMLQLSSQESNQQQADLYRRVLGGESFDVSQTITVGSQEVYLLSSYVPLRNAAGEVTGGAVFARDVTETSNAQKQSEKLMLEALEAADLLKAQEEEMRLNLEELYATQKEMQRVKEAEAQRAKEQIEAANKIMSGKMQQFKQREAELLAQIQQKEAELKSLKSN